jgi:hypothetical protein
VIGHPELPLSIGGRDGKRTLHAFGGDPLRIRESSGNGQGLLSREDDTSGVFALMGFSAVAGAVPAAAGDR